MKIRMRRPADTPMPVPVPPGRFAEYAAAISEGFCPADQSALRPWPSMPEFGPRGDCPDCGANWYLSRHHPGIEWRNRVGETHWEVWTNPDLIDA